MAELKVGWKPRKDNEYLGKEIPRLEGNEKASGHAKFSNDINTKGTLYAKLLTCKHAHAKIKSIDLDAAKKVKGVKGVFDFRKFLDDPKAFEIHYDGTIIAAVVAERPEHAEDGVKAIKVEYEVLDHFVDEQDLKGATEKKRTGEVGNAKKGDVEAALKDAKHVHKGYYGIHTITHMCLEPHGSHCEWKGDDLKVHLSTQNVSGTGGQFAGSPLIGIDAANVEIICNYVGGGFGSKFAADQWGIAAAVLSKELGAPVKLMLDRATELKIAGNRPSGFGNITVACDAEGRITAWDSDHWGSGGFTDVDKPGKTIDINQFPYVFDFENRNRKATGINTNCGPERAWRAPPHPQLCALTCTALDDLAAKAGIDSLEFYRKNIDQLATKAANPDIYRAEFDIAAKLLDWKGKWHPRGEGGKGAVKKGVGLAIHRWGGAAHAATCLVKVHPDGTVESFAGSQDIGTGTRTAIAMVLAETFGIPLSMVKVNIGTNKYPQSGPSGGSTTIGGVSGPNRRAGIEALGKIFDLVAEKYSVKADGLSAGKGKIWSGEKAVCSWKDAAKLIGPMALEVQGKGPVKDGLTSLEVGGVQMVEVAVDTETGKVRVEKFVAVQDCGMIIDLLTAKSQVYGSLIMGIAYSLSEERIMDNKTGRFINADLENYKLPRIGDIGELIVEMYQPDSEYERGVIGLGEPPVIAPGAAISNAVANAIGVRVPVLPLTPQRVLDTLAKAKG